MASCEVNHEQYQDLHGPPVIGRGRFLKMLLFLGVGTAAGLSCGPDQGSQPKDNLVDQLSEEQQRQLQERVWGSLTQVLEEGMFSRNSLVVVQIDTMPMGKYNRKPAEVNIQGTLQGNSRQVGINFSINFSEEPDAWGESLQLDQSIILGEQRKQVIGIDYFTGENAGDVVRVSNFTSWRIARDATEMKQRFDDMGEALKAHLKIPADTSFIPAQDFNGLVTFVNNRPGYGQVIESRGGIDDKAVSFRITDGLLTDPAVWRNITPRAYERFSVSLHIDPSKISFKELLKAALISLNDRDNVSYWQKHHPLKDAPAREYLTQLGRQFLPNESHLTYN